MPFSQRNAAVQPLAITDINQWRRRIQPSRSRTPLPLVDLDDGYAETASTPVTPRKKIRPKLSSYFTQYMPSTGHGKQESPNAEGEYLYQDSPMSETYRLGEHCQPEPEVLMECLMRKLMADPFCTLDARDNSSLMLIFEAYRLLRDQNSVLTERLRSEIESRYIAAHETEKSEKKWQHEAAQYRAEIKGLELLIAKGNQGLVEVVRARQDSVLKRSCKFAHAVDHEDHKETIFEFLERTKAEDDDARRSQRAYLRPRLTSPSRKMTALSHRLSINNPYDKLPFHPSLEPEARVSLSRASYFEDVLPVSGIRALPPHSPLRQSPRTSEGSSSSYCSYNNSIAIESEEQVSSTHQFDCVDIAGNGCAAEPTLERAAALRRPSNVQSSPTFYWNPASKDDSKDDHEAFMATLNTRRDRIAKPAGQRPRPQPLQLEDRRFSFDVGDDPGVDPLITAWVGKGQTQVCLRKSRSLSQLPDGHDIRAQSASIDLGRMETPKLDISNAALPSPSLPVSPAFSKIPSPVFDSSLARPRRGDSSSSLLTAVRHSDDGTTEGSGKSVARSYRSYTSIGLVDSDSKSPRTVSNRSSSESGKITIGRRLVEGKNVLRRNEAVVATARAAAVLDMHSPANSVRAMQS